RGMAKRAVASHRFIEFAGRFAEAAERQLEEAERPVRLRLEQTRPAFLGALHCLVRIRAALVLEPARPRGQRKRPECEPWLLPRLAGEAERFGAVHARGRVATAPPIDPCCGSEHTRKRRTRSALACDAERPLHQQTTGDVLAQEA